MDCSDAYCPPKDQQRSRLNIKANQYSETSGTRERTDLPHRNHTDVTNGKRQTPHRPEMSEFKSRVMTFSRNWPNHIKATVVQLAQAGLYYLGTSDRVKCFHCNGGLKDWARDDDPWFEHCKWYPNCEFLREMKGPDYVHWVSSQFPDLKRPVVRNKNKLVSSIQSALNDVPPPKNHSQADTDVPMTTYDLTGEFEEAKKSELYTEALGFGFDMQVVEAVVKKHLETEHEMYTSLMRLVTDVQEYVPPCEKTLSSINTTEANESTLAETNELSTRTRQSAGMALMSPFPNSKKVTYKKPASPSEHQLPVKNTVILPAASAQEENKGECNSVEEDLCKICLDSKCDCVLMTCGHVCSCVNCASALRMCPICRAHIESIVKFYRK